MWPFRKRLSALEEIDALTAPQGSVERAKQLAIISYRNGDYEWSRKFSKEAKELEELESLRDSLR